MNNLQAFSDQCRLWNDAFLLEEVAKGEDAYADKAFFAALREEVMRRGLSVSTEASAPAAAEDGSLIARLWRGDVPLAEAYWMWGVLFNLVLVAIATPAGTLVLILLPFLIAYEIFILTAIWRSATRYRGPHLWATLAKVVVVSTGVILTTAVLAIMSTL